MAIVYFSSEKDISKYAHSAGLRDLLGHMALQYNKFGKPQNTKRPILLHK